MNTADPPSDEELAHLLRLAVALRDAPPAWVHGAIGLWPAHGISVAGALKRVLAVLTFDSGALPASALLAARSGGGAPRQLLFSASGRDIDLRIAPAAAAWRLAGQVLGPDESGHVDVATEGEQPQVVASAALSSLGEFVIEGLNSGRYQLLLTLGDELVVVPAVAVGPAGSP
jgi:hypothetical protein